MLKVYGIKNCDTVKKALVALDKTKLDYEFIDFKKEKPTKELILKWKDFMKDWPVNTRGPTYRKIKEDFEKATDTKKIALLIEASSAIKRPLIEKNGKPKIAGFDEEAIKKLKA
ncbi:MAG: arsenate reductase [Bdellovibrionales bacterium CG12_big_fil_rev_8_21_14_0_65_38_15]|nr:MAG: arsenate reductase [Bdellovibrionales bacterium CG12_big_fil_rev_8_21_14_0_65_38_15]